MVVKCIVHMYVIAELKGLLSSCLNFEIFLIANFKQFSALSSSAPSSSQHVGNVSPAMPNVRSLKARV